MIVESGCNVYSRNRCVEKADTSVPVSIYCFNGFKFNGIENMRHQFYKEVKVDAPVKIDAAGEHWRRCFDVDMTQMVEAPGIFCVTVSTLMFRLHYVDVDVSMSLCRR